MKAVSRVFSQENPDSGTSVSVGELGREEMQDVKEMDVKDGDLGGGTERGINMTSICGLPGVEMEMVWYHSCSAHDRDW